MVTNFASDFATPHRRMASTHPSWRVRTTATHIWTSSWHPVTSCTSETIPAYAEISLVTPYLCMTTESHKTVRCVKNIVMFAWVKYCRETRVKNTSVRNVGEDRELCKQMTKTSVLPMPKNPDFTEDRLVHHVSGKCIELGRQRKVGWDFFS